MRLTLLILSLVATTGCSVNRLYLRPVAEVRSSASDTLECPRDEIVVRRLGSMAYERTASVDPYVAEGCGEHAFFLCDSAGGAGQCMQVSEPPYQPPAAEEQTALVQVLGTVRDSLPHYADHYWERVSFGDGYSARYLAPGSAVSVPLRPRFRTIRLTVGPTWVAERSITLPSTEYRTERCWEGGRLATCTTMETTHTTYRWNEREHRATCHVDATLQPEAGAVYQVRYEVVNGGCRASCTKLGAESGTCEGWTVLR